MTVYELSVSFLTLPILQYLPVPFLACDELSTAILIIVLFVNESFKFKQILKFPTVSSTTTTESNVTFT